MEPTTLAEQKPRLGQLVSILENGQWHNFLYMGDVWQMAHEHRPTQPTDQWKPVAITAGENWRQPT